MSIISKAVKNENILRERKAVRNFMDGVCYVYDPLSTLKIITASSIFGEASYYRDSDSRPKYYNSHSMTRSDSIIPVEWLNNTTDYVMTQAIDSALEYDYVGTLEWAVELRTVYNIRLNPQIIMVRAAIHPKRKEYTTNGLDFNKYQSKVMARADEPMMQLAYYLYINKSKNNIPSILKRTWAKRLSLADSYEVNKYKNAEIGMINCVRVCHAHSSVIDALMRTGTVSVPSTKKTWEQYKSEGKSWVYILKHCKMGHMALLRNLHNIFVDIDNTDILDDVIDKLISGVPYGKQFPYRYWTAYKTIKNSDRDVHHKNALLNALELCIDKSVENMPKLKGTTMVLTDNSGSAWGTIPSEYGSVTVAEIDNLSAIITAKRSDKGYVGVFGDDLKIIEVSKYDKVLGLMEELNEIGKNIGPATENGNINYCRCA